jgi:malonate decarboxylase epsilon subunit
MNTALLFPGQGSQQPQMLHDLVRHPSVDDTLSEASGILGFDVRTLDSADALQSTVSVQLALLVVGVATARAFQRSGLQPLAVAGLSVGAFAAAVAAEALAFPDAIRLVRSRAEQMEQMYPAGYGLSAIVGLTENHVVRLVNTANSLERPVFVSNINAPKQIVIAGSIEGMKIVLEQALRQGARKAELLEVSVPSHCPLLQPIADSLRGQLRSISLRDPKTIYIANVNARSVRTAQGVAKDLADNIAHGVRWHDATCVAQELGSELFLNVPPGHVLTDLAKENLSDMQAQSVTPANFRMLLELAKL